MGSHRRILHTLAASALAATLSTGCVARTQAGRSSLNAISVTAFSAGLLVAGFGVVRMSEDPPPCVPEEPRDGQWSFGCAFSGLGAANDAIEGMMIALGGVALSTVGGLELLINNQVQVPDAAPPPPPAPRERLRLPFLPGT